ncbi:Os04g0384332 [Oryza sativa Japonica Group]|uniref:Os04g0384332 protein n=1 Tax=Oryza sativa subsp. japonica TaxID=39947 RepID=A0A0P0W9F2_ORYSJ|nr:Os04g0384332 [Oryza sativa Japonica Group]
MALAWRQRQGGCRCRARAAGVDHNLVGYHPRPELMPPSTKSGTDDNRGMRCVGAMIAKEDGGGARSGRTLEVAVGMELELS